MSTTRTSGPFRCSVSQSVEVRGSKFFISLLLEYVVFAGVGFGDLAGLFFVILAETALYDLVPEVVFEGPDPRPRPSPELQHEVVAVERALKPLHGVLGPNLFDPTFQAAPGRLGDAPAQRRAPRDVRPGELQEHVHVSEHPVAAREVGVPDKAPDGGVAPRVPARGVPVRAHVVSDEVGGGVYGVVRVGKPAHRPPGDAGADVLVAVEVDLLGHGPATAVFALAFVRRLLQALHAAVRAAVLVDKGARLADVVEKRGLAQNGVRLDVRDHD